jgi:peptidoglycan/xylan/chitin deacetylase (PgdA/CDA1 family)
MPERHHNHNGQYKQHGQRYRRVASNGGAAAAKALIAASTVLLAVCVSVFTFLALTRIEAWLADRGNRAPASVIIANNANESAAVNNAGDDYADAAPIAAETNIGWASSEIVNDDFTDGGRPPQAQASSSYQSYRSSRTTEYAPPPQQYTPASIPRFVPPQGPAVPYIIDNASPDISYFALTFDGGSFANAAGDILDTLASRGVRSTMFLTGEFIRRHPQVVSRIAAEGHELGNHTLKHPRLTTYADDRTQSTRYDVSRQTVINELEGAARVLADRTGLRFAPFWRAPYGEYNRQICGWALEAGYIHVGWRPGRTWSQNLDTNDWVPDAGNPAYKSPHEVFAKIVNIAAQPGGLNGGIILMHLGTERKSRSEQVHIILGRLIDTLRDMGYEPVTVSELLYKSGIDVNALAFQNRGAE